MEVNSRWLSSLHSCAVSFHHHVGSGPQTHPHILFVVLFPAGLPYLPSPSLVFLYVFSGSLFSIWNLLYPLSGSIDPLSYRPPASWCPLFTVTQAIIACRSFLIISMLAAVFPADAIGLLIYHRENPEDPLAFCSGRIIHSEAYIKNKKKQPNFLINVDITFGGRRLENRLTVKPGFAHDRREKKTPIHFSGSDIQRFLWMCP